MNSDNVKGQQYGLSFDIAKSLRYHAYRRRFFDRLDKITKIFVVGTGGATFFLLVTTPETFWAKTCTLALTTLTAFDVIIGFSNAARLHDKLYRDFALLGRDIVGTTSPAIKDIAQWNQRRLEIETEEPAAMDWLERRCCKEEAEARGAPVDKAWCLPGWKVQLSQFISG